MGELVDLGAARAARTGADVVELPEARISWDAERRIVRLLHKAGHEMDLAAGKVLGGSVLRWVGAEPAGPYGLLVEGSGTGDSLGTVAYRRFMSKGAQRHRDHIRMVYYGGTAQTRFLAATYLKGVGVPGAVVDSEADALRWLAEQGVG